MIPQVSTTLRTGLSFEELPSRTYRLDATRDTLGGFVDGRAAVEQAIYLILHTERYQHLIYSWNYGAELVELYGKPIPFVLPELKRRITEALTQDTRITAVDNFGFEQQRGTIRATFTAHTIFGDIQAERTVMV